MTIDFEDLSPELQDYISDLRSSHKKVSAELKEALTEQDAAKREADVLKQAKATEDKARDVRTMDRKDYKKAKQRMLRDFILQQRGDPTEVPKVEVENLRALSKDEYRKMRAAFLRAMRGGRNR